MGTDPLNYNVQASRSHLAIISVRRGEKLAKAELLKLVEE